MAHGIMLVALGVLSSNIYPLNLNISELPSREAPIFFAGGVIGVIGIMGAIVLFA